MDVMPVDPVELWHTQPFEPVIKDGKIWARGADDDKGQSFMHAKSFEYMVKTGNLKCNVNLCWKVKKKSVLRACRNSAGIARDAESRCILVSDTSMIAPDVPSITTGLRGLAYWEVEMVGEC